MALDIPGVLRNLARVSPTIKQGNFLSAAQTIRSGLQAAMSTQQLLRAEQEELSRLLSEGCAHLSNNTEIRKMFPLAIAYKPGEEQTLLSTLGELIGILQNTATQAAERLTAQMAEKKRVGLAKGQQHLDAGELDHARQTFSALADEFHSDGELVTDIGERYLQGGHYEDAAHYLEKAVSLSPDAAHGYNRLGIALRKLKRFDASEENFRKALGIEKNDPNLYFNLGRLYLDAGRWTDSISAAEAALKIAPNFSEASKLAAYAKKKATE